MNYKHIYHAGSHTDVFKHIVLIALLNAMQQKDKPFLYLETHAGSGNYDLTQAPAQKSKEYLTGVDKIIHVENAPPLIQQYLSHIKPNFYPGSPLIAKQELRKQDRMIACELEKGEYAALKKLFAHNKQVAIHQQDGLLALKAFLPPQEKRGLILIDSPFEKPNEFENLCEALKPALERFPQGIYAIWYPLKDHNSVKRFHYMLKNLGNYEILILELSIYPDIPQTLFGSGMAIINPPWTLKDTMAPALSFLWKTLSINDQGGISLHFLK